MSNPGLGQKRRCLECEAAFYDLNRDPITCPKCGAVHQPPVARLKSDGRTPPKGRVPPKRQPAPVLEPAVAVAPADDTIDKDFDAEAEESEDEDEDDDDDETEDGADATPAEEDETK